MKYLSLLLTYNTNHYIISAVKTLRRNLKMKAISKKELIDLVNDIKGATFVSIDIATTPRMKKTNNPYFDKVTSASTLSGQINYDYENSINLQLEREGSESAGNFKSQPRSWGSWEDNWITHKGEHYLPVRVLSRGESVFFVDGEKIDIDKIKPFLHESKHPKTQEDLEKKIAVRDIKISNIQIIRINKEEYRVV